MMKKHFVPFVTFCSKPPPPLPTPRIPLKPSRAEYIWLALVLGAVLLGGATGQMKEVTTAAFEACKTAVMTLALPLAGVMALWLGVMRLAEKSG